MSLQVAVTIPELPDSWRISRLGYQASVKARLGWKGLKAEEYVNEGYIFLSTPNLKAREIDFENVNYITEQRYRESPEIMLQQGDVLLAKDGATLGIVNLIRHLPALATVNGSIAVVRPRASLDPRFLFYLIASAYIQSIIQQVKGGMGVPHLFQSDLRRFPVFYPPLPTQRAIADFLDRKTRAIDDLIRKKERLIELLQEKRQALVTQAVTKGLPAEAAAKAGLDPNVPMKDSGVPWLGEIPAHWEVKRLKHLSPHVTVGIVVTPSKYYADGGVPALRSLNVSAGSLSDQDLVCLTPEGHHLHSKSALREGDLVAVRTGKPGTTAVVDSRFAGANCVDLIIARRSQWVASDYLCYVMNSAFAHAQYESGSEGALQLHFNIETAENLLIPTPPLEEQRAVLRALDATSARLDETVRALARQIDCLREYRQALISAAVTGQIDVTGTNSRRDAETQRRVRE